jgi:hypothetical protein
MPQPHYLGRRLRLALVLERSRKGVIEMLSQPIPPKPRNITKMTLPIATVQAMRPEHRSALLMLGLFLNEANWLRKLLVKAVQGVADTQRGKLASRLPRSSRLPWPGRFTRAGTGSTKAPCTTLLRDWTWIR